MVNGCQRVELSHVLGDLKSAKLPITVMGKWRHQNEGRFETTELVRRRKSEVPLAFHAKIQALVPTICGSEYMLLGCANYVVQSDSNYMSINQYS